MRATGAVFLLYFLTLVGGLMSYSCNNVFAKNVIIKSLNNDFYNSIPCAKAS
jgi:hypothetical protein